MKNKILIGILGVGALALGTARTAEASALLNLSDSVTTKTCNTGLAINNVVGGNCAQVEGFQGVVAGDNTITFIGSVGGYSVGLGLETGNQPGEATNAFVQLTNATVKHNAGVTDLVIDFGGNNFSSPASNPLVLSASQTGNYTASTVNDQSNLTGYGRNDNVLGVPGGVSTVVPACLPGAGNTTSCSKVSPDVAFSKAAGNFALLGRLDITQTVGSASALYTSTVAVNAVPEPASMLLFGSGLVGLASRARARRRQKKA